MPPTPGRIFFEKTSDLLKEMGLNIRMILTVDPVEDLALLEVAGGEVRSPHQEPPSFQYCR